MAVSFARFSASPAREAKQAGGVSNAAARTNRIRLGGDKVAQRSS